MVLQHRLPRPSASVASANCSPSPSFAITTSIRRPTWYPRDPSLKVTGEFGPVSFVLNPPEISDEKIPKIPYRLGMAMAAHWPRPSPSLTGLSSRTRGGVRSRRFRRRRLSLRCRRTPAARCRRECLARPRSPRKAGLHSTRHESALFLGSGFGESGFRCP